MRDRVRFAAVSAVLAGAMLSCLTAGWAAAAAAASSRPVVSAASPAGYKIVSAGFSAPGGADTSGSVACPKVSGAQTVPLSGGVLIDGTSLDLNVNSSWPATDGWNARVSNASAAAAGFTVYAVCAKKMTGYLQQKSKAVSNPAGEQNGAGYECPAGDSLLGGGALSTSRSVLVNLSSSWPSGTRFWYVYLNNASSAPASFSVYHLCAKINVSATHYQLVDGTPVLNPAGKQTEASVFCPSGLSAIGGGVVSQSSSVEVSLNTTFPFAGGWGGDENNASSTAANLTAFVLCAS